MYRRDFLTTASAASMVSFAARAPSLLAAAAATAPQTDHVVVVVQLTGGNDGLNMVVPYGDDEYHRRRPTLRYTAEQIHRLNDEIGLHPSMEKFANLFHDGKATVVQGVGYPQPNRSHFESMDLWHSAHGTGALRQTGWLGRWLDRKSEASGSPSIGAVHVGTDSLPRALWSRAQPAVSMHSLDSMQLPQLKEYGTTIDRLLDRPLLKGGGSLVERVAEQSRIAVATSRSLSQAGKLGASRSDYPGGALAERLHAVARMICANMPARVYYVTLDGFDTHASQQNAHAALLGQLSDSVAAFTEDLASFGLGDRLRMMIFSEFGRRVQENASRGTDHGAAGPVLIVGDPTLPMVLGKPPNLNNLDADGDLKFEIDYRRVYATVLDRWLLVDSPSLLGGKFEPLVA